MKKAGITAMILAASLMMVSCASVSPNLTSSQVQVFNTEKGKFVELPQGLKINSILETELSSERSKAGDPFVVRTLQAVTLDGKPLIPGGTLIHGHIVSVKPTKANLTKAKLELSLDTISLGGGKYPFQEKATLDKSDMVKKLAATGGQEAAKKAAAIAFPPLEAVFIADDVIKGVNYYESSKEIVLPPGTPLIVKVNSPVSIPLH
jgi:hypothetical protein